MFTQVKTDAEIESMRTSGKMLASVLNYVKTKVKPGISSKDLATLAARELKKLGGQPAFLGYQGFPDVLCVSINEEVVHGIPRASKIISNGDIVSLDFGVNYRGMITDAAISTIAGVSHDKKVQLLLKTTHQALMAGIDTIREGVRVGDISANIQAVLDKQHFGIVRDLVGHGVGHHLHEEPNIPNYGVSGSGPALKKNITIAIEPMATLGGYDINIAEDGWTVRTRDGSWAAHFEHTVLITKDSAEIITTL